MMAQDERRDLESRAIDPDPPGHRPGQLHTIAVMTRLAARTDLPIAKWAVEPTPDYYKRDGSYEQTPFPTLDGHIWSQYGRERAALAVWAAAFGVGIEEEPHHSVIHAHVRFTVDGVPVDVVAVYDPDDPAEEE